MNITNDQREILEHKLSEGMEFCFLDYSGWNEIEDEEFHELRIAYLRAHEAFRTYLENNGLIEYQ